MIEETYSRKDKCKCGRVKWKGARHCGDCFDKFKDARK